MLTAKLDKFERQFEALARWIESKPLWWFAVLSILLHILRQPSALIQAQFWAEDGKEFFREDFLLGPAAFLKTYAGYLHLWPRLVAFMLGFLPTLWLPFLYKCFALLTHGILLAVIAGRRFPGDHLQKAIMMLAIALVPHNGEAFLNLANTISFCCLLMAAVTLTEPPEKLTGKLFEMLCLFVLAGSGPYVFFVLPLALGYSLFKAIKPRLLRLAGMTAGLALQVLYFSFADRPENMEVDPAFSVWAKALRVAFKCLVFGKVPFPRAIDWLLAVFVFGALLLCFWPALRDLVFRRLRFSASLFLIAVAIANLGASMYVGRMYLDLLGPYGGASRYYFLSYILILWAIVLDWNLEPYGKLRKYLIGLSFFFSVLNFSSMMPKRDLNWAAQVDELKTTGKVEMHVLPPLPNWIFPIERESAWRK